MAERAPKHTHKFKRHKYKNGEQIYFCMQPRCRFRCEVHLALGEECICHRCGKVFQMNEASIRLAKPHCNGCTFKKSVTVVDEVSTILPEHIEYIEERIKSSHINDLRSRIHAIQTSPSEPNIPTSSAYRLDDDDIL